jgi:hypothetical protein
VSTSGEECLVSYKILKSSFLKVKIGFDEDNVSFDLISKILNLEVVGYDKYIGTNKIV